MVTYIVIAVIGLLVALCIRNLVIEHKRGERCECIGDCSKRKIQCQSNPNYYGVQRNPAKEQTVKDKGETI